MTACVVPARGRAGIINSAAAAPEILDKGGVGLWGLAGCATRRNGDWNKDAESGYSLASIEVRDALTDGKQ